jgi:hypothetical protein
MIKFLVSPYIIGMAKIKIQKKPQLIMKKTSEKQAWLFTVAFKTSYSLSLLNQALAYPKRQRGAQS